MTSVWFGDWWGAEYSATWWGDTGSAPPTPVVTPTPSGGWRERGNYSFLDYHARRDALRREERELALKSRQRKTIRKSVERIAGGLAEAMPQRTAQADIMAAVVAAEPYQAMVRALAIKDAERRQAIADYALRVILLRIMELQEEDDAIAVFLLMGD